MFGFFKRRRRERLRSTPWPESWRQLVAERVPLLAELGSAERGELEGLVQVFLGEKTFEGCGGQEVDSAVRLIIASQACLLLVGRGTDVYPTLRTILIYPEAYVAPLRHEHADGLVDEGEEERVGESWGFGSVVLAWDDVEASARRHREGYNVVLHEMAHQLDAETGFENGAPLFDSAAEAARWAEVMEQAYDRHCAAVDGGRRTLIDPYGAESPAEFFAVLVEAFFEIPERLKPRHPDIYGVMRAYFNQDPASRRRS